MNETTSVTLPDDLLQAISDGDSDRALKAIKAVPAGDLTTAVSRMGVDARERLLSLLDPQDGCPVAHDFR